MHSQAFPVAIRLRIGQAERENHANIAPARPTDAADLPAWIVKRARQQLRYRASEAVCVPGWSATPWAIGR